MQTKKIISLILPCYNEEKNIQFAYSEIKRIWTQLNDHYNYEIIFVDDGSKDNTVKEIEEIMKVDSNIKLLEFSRNFGKEIAMTAGFNHCTGDAAIVLDVDMQYPIEKLPEFVSKWENGAEVVVGVRDKKKTKNIIEILGSKLFYYITNIISDIQIKPGALDYRLIDRIVINEFNRFTERGRMTRALIDWLGYKRDYVHYVEKPRQFGEPAFNFNKRLILAFNTFIVTSLVPLRLAGMTGVVITIISGLFGIFVILQKYILNGAWGMNFSGPFLVGVLNMFFTGIIMSSLGLIALYIENMHIELLNRPLYVLRKNK